MQKHIFSMWSIFLFIPFVYILFIKNTAVSNTNLGLTENNDSRDNSIPSTDFNFVSNYRV